MSYWDNPELDIVYDFVEMDFEGTPVHIKIPDWENVMSLTFQNEDGTPFTSSYLQTDLGLLRIDSKRLASQLKPLKGSKRRIVIQRWREGKDNRSTVYKVEEEPIEISKKRTTAKKK